MRCKHCKKDNNFHTDTCPAISSKADSGRAWVEDRIRQASLSGMYGKVVVYLEAGVPVRLTVEESVKPPAVVT